MCEGGNATNGCATGDRKKVFDEGVNCGVIVWSMKVSVNGGCTISETEREERKEGPVWEDLLCGIAIELFVSVVLV